MKRILALILTLVLALAVGMTPLSFAADAQPAKVTGLQITTANKQKLLKLTWDKQTGADGYQIYRSETGKTGSYQKIASVRDKTAYVDKGLKAAKTYYYKVRAFDKQNGKTVYGAFTGINLSTRLTKHSLQKLIQKANKISFGWTMNALDEHAALDLRDQKKVMVNYGDDDYAFEQTFAHIRHDRYHCVADIENDLNRYFFKSLYQYYIDTYYRDIDGKLYGIVGDTGGEYYGTEGILKISSASDTVYRVRIQEFGLEGETISIDRIKLVYKNGRWLFTDLLSNWGLFEVGNQYWL